MVRARVRGKSPDAARAASASEPAVQDLASAAARPSLEDARRRRTGGVLPSRVHAVRRHVAQA